MTILSVIRQACPRIGLSVPTGVFSSSAREHVELQQLANDTATMIAEETDWQKFKEIHTITGDGTEEDFDLPDDLAWIPNGSQLWSSELAAPLAHVKDEDAWLRDLVLEAPTLVNSWIIYADQVHIRAALSDGATVKFFYQTNEIVLDADTTVKTLFESDDDTFRLDEELLRLGMIYKWKLDKGLPYAQHQDEYAARLEKKIGRDIGPRRIRIGGRGLRGAEPAYPSRLGGT